MPQLLLLLLQLLLPLQLLPLLMPLAHRLDLDLPVPVLVDAHIQHLAPRLGLPHLQPPGGARRRDPANSTAAREYMKHEA